MRNRVGRMLELRMVEGGGHLGGWLIGAAAGLVLASACGDYQKYYKAEPENGAVSQPFAGEPAIEPSSGDTWADYLAMYKRGYHLVGRSNFNGRKANSSDALTQARKVGARYVVIAVQYTGTDHRELVIPGSGTTETTHS